MTIEEMTADIQAQLLAQGHAVGEHAARGMAEGIVFYREHTETTTHPVDCGCLTTEELLASLGRREAAR